MHDHLSNSRIVQVCTPWYPVFEQVCLTGGNDARACFALTGHLRPAERANLVHATIREAFREAAELADPFIKLVEEPERNGGLDYLRLNWDGTEIAVRWGRFKNGAVSRRDSERQRLIQEQYMLFDGMDREVRGLPVVTLGYEVSDEFTIVGVPQWWLSGLELIRERQDESEPIQHIVSYKQPVQTLTAEEMRDIPRIVARYGEIDKLTRTIKKIRRSA